MCKKEVPLSLEEKKELYDLICAYEKRVERCEMNVDEACEGSFKDEVLEARLALESFLEKIGFELRFPGRDEIVEYDLRAMHSLFIDGAELNMSEVQVSDSDKDILEANISSINRVLSDYHSSTPWTDHDVETLMAETQDAARRLGQLIEKLEVFDVPVDGSSAYFKRICLK